MGGRPVKITADMNRQVTLDMVQYENIVVRRVLQNNAELVKTFNVTAFPSGFLLFSNGSCSAIPVQVDSRPLYKDFLRRLPGVFRAIFPDHTVRPTAEPKTTPAFWRVADRKRLYMADLESAIMYTLRVEAARFLFLDREHLFTLKQYVAILVKYFPGRLIVMNYLRNLDHWLRPRTNVSNSEWEEALRNKKELPYAWLPETPTWVGCQGSKSEYRGYPCSLWTLFHLLTVQEAVASPRFTSSSEVLPTMRRYVHYFFGCRECADHFEGMAAESMHRVKSKDGAVLWLWSRHNRVNARLAGTKSDDPKFPKIQWPPHALCWSCQLIINGRRMWDERAVLRFLKSHFSRRNIDMAYVTSGRGRPGRYGRDVEENDLEAEGNLEEGGGENGPGADEELDSNSKRTERPDRGREEKKRSSSDHIGASEPRRPSIIKIGKSSKTKELENDIVDLDSFSEQHYKSKALKAAAQANEGRRRSRRDTGLVLMEDESNQSFDYDAVWGRKGPGGQHIVDAMEEEPGRAGVTTLRRSQWFRLLGVGFSRLDVSLCIVLYLLSSMCLLGMYTFFRMRMRYHKGRPGFPLA
uniref:Uncharacterized protein n=1 Tax=Sphaerodactylus townsendi TaxID=933632 RepID=A0ACB8F2B7_9SAUR